MSHQHTLVQHKLPMLLAACAAAASVAFGPAAANAQANQPQRAAVRLPAGLHWQKMAGVSFDFSPRTYGTPAQRRLAKEIWKERLDKPDFDKGPRGRSPAFILLSTFDDGTYRYIFTSLDAAPLDFDVCEPPPNGGDASTPTYSTCPMRVVIENRKTGEQRSQEFPNYCVQFPDDDPSEPGKSETQIAFDKAKKTAYFRVIQYSKPRPECNRAIRLG